MRFVVIIFFQLLSFSVNSSYLFEYGTNQETFIRSTNEGQNSRIRFCQTKKGDDVVFQFDCNFSNQAVESYFQHINKTLNAFIKITSESRLVEFYKLEQSNICLLVVPENKGYNRRERISDCVTFYVPVTLSFDKYSSASLATTIASISHEIFHKNFNPFVEQGAFNKLLINEYAASLLTLNSYRILNNYLKIEFNGRWRNELAEKFSVSNDLDKYCKDYGILKEKNKKMGNEFESVMGSILASIFTSKIGNIDLLPIYIFEELSHLSFNNLSEEQILDRLGLCGSDIDLAKISLRLVDFNLSKTLEVVNSAKLSSEIDCVDVEDICKLFLVNADQYTYFKMPPTSSGKSFNEFVELQVGNVFRLNDNMRFTTPDGSFIVDSGAESNVWPEGEVDCDIEYSEKEVRNLSNEIITLTRCTELSGIGVVWTSKLQKDKVLSLRNLTQFYDEFYFINDTRMQLKDIVDSEDKETFNYIYINGLIVFQSDDLNINYCLDTGSQFSLYSLRLQEAKLLYPFSTEKGGFHSFELPSKTHILISFKEFEPLIKLKPKAVMAPEHCDLIVGADLLGKYKAFSIAPQKLTFYKN
ncbi:hypothetical protein VT06_06755 [Arsukibacterium sp. MJ3]|jgi:hypothetical protein|uniref:hypothetical protein n=1 Tax=Arsukibacterium sp. MJ3 TaxID=1632859 RepID=UPI0006270207|nr:hypothetical protein [Arsukibacterium sp. MJ3]KKO49523.1 hypothetical protein VT06_06755 [Arsukibacterium sp. MJ3]